MSSYKSLVSQNFMPFVLNKHPLTLSRSLAVSERNTLFRKSMELLASEGVKQDQAREIVKEAFKEADLNRRAESIRGFEKDKRVEKRIPFMDQLMDWQCKHYCTEKCVSLSN